jgi:predicted thioesterase
MRAEPPAEGLSGEVRLRFTVTNEDTAEVLGSGDLPVLGTPRLLAWCEAATCAVLAPSLWSDQTSVGTRVSLDHLAPSPIGAEIEVGASVAYADGRLRRFTVSARDCTSGKVLAAGEITRVVVDRERFLRR